MTKLKWQLAAAAAPAASAVAASANPAAAFAAASLSSHSLLEKGFFQAFKLFNCKQMDGSIRLYCSSQ